ncbi:MAG: DUF5671 domain-containing protein [Patescibacteria group bacterium]
MDFIKKTSPKDIFLHLLAIVTLYASATSFLVLAFQYVNLSFPDPLEYGDFPISGIRWAIATLIVVFPVHLFTMRKLGKDYALDPEKRGTRIRKWLVYFTLFVAALIMIGDFVTLINNFLQGDLTIRFLLKVVAVLFVAGSIFWYYISDLKHQNETKKMRYFAYVITIIIAAGIVAGFFAVGSPMRERLSRFDSQRVQDLQMIQNELLYYWQAKNRLPKNLAELDDDIRGFTAPSDPETKTTQYGYEMLSSERFKLCAVFSLPSRSLNKAVESVSPRGGYGIDENWTHKEGQACFSRTIDKDYFKPRPVPAY